MTEDGILTSTRYIQLQEEYIKDEQRSIFYTMSQATFLVLTVVQESEKRIGSRARGDQARPECSIGYRAIYGSH